MALLAPPTHCWRRATNHSSERDAAAAAPVAGDPRRFCCRDGRRVASGGNDGPGAAVKANIVTPDQINGFAVVYGSFLPCFLFTRIRWWLPTVSPDYCC